MSLTDKMMDAFDRTGDWVARGSAPVVSAKIAAVAGTAIGTVLSPFFLAAHIGAKNLEERINFLDHHPTEIFQSISGCEDRHFAKNTCQESQQEALSVAKSLGTSLEYDTLAECTMNHKVCSEDSTAITTHITNYTKVGDQNITNTQSITTNISSYYPPIVAWQAAADDLTKAVPLYPTQRDNVVVRSDGVEFDIEALSPR